MTEISYSHGRGARTVLLLDVGRRVSPLTAREIAARNGRGPPPKPPSAGACPAEPAPKPRPLTPEMAET